MKFSDERIQGIIHGRRVVGRSPFPGNKDVEIGVRLLSERDIDLARFEAQMYLESQAKRVQLDMIRFVQIDPESFDREHQRQVIFRAFVDPDTPEERPETFFADASEVRSLDSVLTQQLWEIYVDWQDTVNPRITLTEEEVVDLVEALKKERMANHILASFGRNTLTSLARTLAARLRT
jgi:hypothetical protein